MMNYEWRVELNQYTKIDTPDIVDNLHSDSSHEFLVSNSYMRTY